MKILVTGANGYLGQGIVKELLNLGNYVIAADFTSENIDNRADITCCSIFDVEKPYEYFNKPDIVLHLAWKNGFVHNADNHIADLPKHYEFLKKMIDGGTKRVCVMGSMHEIGFFEGAINDNTPCNPMSMYGIAKNSLRQSVEIYAKEKEAQFIWLRGYYIVSNDVKGSSIFSKIAKAANEGKTEFPFTSGKNQYDFLDYDDFCYRVAKASIQEKITGIINICSGKPESLSSRVERFIKDNQYNIKLKYGAFPDRPYDSKAIWGDSSKIAEILG
ncbi:MAG: NAD(P)-dependent oxidoreductase [Ruminococcus sp.]|nr:NAD(P)-dependent oxidoreductase [Ruminococcus sp.]